MSFDPVTLIADYVRHASVSTDPSYAAGMTGARDYVCGILQRLGCTIEVVPTPLHPLVLARREGPEHWPHVLVYGHYDVQPPDPLALWTSPPFEPVVRGERLYGRGAADNKGPQAVQFTALWRLLQRRPDLPLRLTFLIEGEEEIGSPSIPGFLAERGRALSAADMVILSDTGCPNPDQLVITTGLRGLMGMEVEVFGPRSDLHSGVHGGAVLNPIEALATLVASLHDADGRVNVPGFYDGVEAPASWEREQLHALASDAEGYRQFLGVSAFRPEKGFSPFEAVRFRPTLEFNGIGGGYQGEGSKTVIPSRAMAKITCRLVPGQDPDRIYRLVVQALQERCPAGVRVETRTKQGGRAYVVVPPGREPAPQGQSPVLVRAFSAADQAIGRAFGRKPLYLREGGSVPIIGMMKETLGLDSLMLGLFTPECHLHAPDESFHLGLMHRAINVYEEVFEGMAQGGR